MRWLLIFLLLISLVNAVDNGTMNDTNGGITIPGQPNDNVPIYQPENTCGDGIPQIGEGCQTCPQDVKCGENEKCINNKCVYEEKRNFALIIGVVGGILLLTGVVAFYFHRKEKKEIKKIEKQAKEVKKEQKQAEKEVKREFYKAAPKKEIKIELRKKLKKIIKEPIKKEVTKDKLYYYIEKQFKKGINKEHIRNKLISRGWDEKTVREKVDYIYGTGKAT